METSGIHGLQTVFLLLLTFVVLFGLLARRLRTPYPIVLVLAGLLLGFVPGMPRIVLDPQVVFLVVLPPLLFAAAWKTSWREFKFNLVSIFLLAFGLVAFTVVAIAFAAPAFLPGFDWRLGFVLGAVIATTDAIAATSIAKSVGLPRRIVDILEGESLLNDATGLLALEFGTAMVVHGQTPSVVSGLLRLLWLTAGGLAIGLVAGYLVDRLERHIDNGPIEMILSILVPYATYVGAEAAHASGVLAVVACGLLLSRRSAEFFSANVRLQAGAIWETLNFMLNGLTFVLIGLQLPSIRAGIVNYSTAELVRDGFVLTLVLILLRLTWTYPGAYVATWIRRRFLHQEVEFPSIRQVFLVGWTGMRGVVALAAALSLPTKLANGESFPQRNLILFLTFTVILVTLVPQGLSLPWMIRRLGLVSSAGDDREEKMARRMIIEAALDFLDKSRQSDHESLYPIYDDLASHYREKLDALDEEEPADSATPNYHERFREISKKALEIERQSAVSLRRQGQIGDDLFGTLERELDLSETSLRLAPR